MTIYLAPFAQGRNGPSQAPHAILAARNGAGLHHSRIAEIPIDRTSAANTANNIERALTGKDKYLVLGGDHSITAGIVRARAKSGPVHVVMFDAHSDDYGVNKVLDCGNWVKALVDDGILFELSWLNYRNNQNIVTPVISIPKDHQIHVTVDIDVLNPAEYGWATGYPELGGCSLERLISDIETLAGYTNITADFVEYDPTSDTSNRIGAQAAVQVVTSLLRVIAA